MEKKLLLIANDPSSVKDLSISLAGHLKDFIIQTCNKKSDIIAAIEKADYQLVLLDIRMTISGFRGIEIARKINEVNPAARIIVVTDFEESYLSSLKTELPTGKILEAVNKGANLRETALILSHLIQKYYESPAFFSGFDYYGQPLEPIDSDILSDNTATLKWASMGDSITSQNRWQPAVIRNLSLTHTNLGVSGTRMAGTGANCMWQDQRILAIPRDTEVFTIMAGMNDWAANIPMGDIESTDTMTYMGAYNVCLQKIARHRPKVKVFVMGVTFAHFPPSGRTDQGKPWVSAERNQLGYNTNDYTEAARQIAKKWGVKFINTAALGWNAINKRHYLSDEVHPATAGVQLIAQEVINELYYRIRFVEAGV